MEFIFFLILIVFMVAVVAGSIALSNLRYRATQHILKGSGIASTDITKAFGEAHEVKNVDNFLKDHPEYTKETIKEFVRECSVQVMNRNVNENFEQEVCDKMMNDSKLDTMINMEFRRVTLNYYNGEKLNTVAIYSDGRDEYNFYLNFKLQDNKIILEKYQIAKGATIGF